MKKRGYMKLGQVSLLKLVPTIFKIIIIWLLAFFVLYLLMEILGDAATNKVGKEGAEAVALLQQKMGLDRSL